ncbi:hypothetical protein LOTGIDRAFT_168057 [Lottia gigantea]|uniref:Uncharacterized protein n=1 Tax=Lottia gigantea TaxID=225164 RepID=V3ZR60_LOTGI|nr:hypothetical protein LOTGIDRAFT_168057 [Lottia gigantea]ESO85040.1 hypothetical protein LOTGIDRAFT_168057 [Lottia gigantea]
MIRRQAEIQEEATKSLASTKRQNAIISAELDLLRQQRELAAIEVEVEALQDINLKPKVKAPGSVPSKGEFERTQEFVLDQEEYLHERSRQIDPTSDIQLRYKKYQKEDLEVKCQSQVLMMIGFAFIAPKADKMK